MSKKEVRVFETYRFYDHAIAEHVEPEVVGEYAEKRDPLILNLPPEARPVVFRCTVLTRTQRNRINEIGNQQTKLLAAFKFGIQEIRDIPKDDGTYASWTPQRSKEGGQIDDRAMEVLEDTYGFGDLDFWEIGGVVIAHSFLAQGAPVFVPQQPSSQLAWVAMDSRCRAERKRAAETEETESQSSSS